MDRFRRWLRAVVRIVLVSPKPPAHTAASPSALTASQRRWLAARVTGAVIFYDLSLPIFPMFLSGIITFAAKRDQPLPDLLWNDILWSAEVPFFTIGVAIGWLRKLPSFRKAFEVTDENHRVNVLLSAGTYLLGMIVVLASVFLGIFYAAKVGNLSSSSDPMRSLTQNAEVILAGTSVVGSIVLVIVECRARIREEEGHRAKTRRKRTTPPPPLRPKKPRLPGKKPKK